MPAQRIDNQAERSRTEQSSVDLMVPMVQIGSLASQID
jgi:hypothetical protein